MPAPTPDRLAAERLVVANAFHDGAWLSTATRDCQPDLFLEPRNRCLWRAIVDAHIEGEPANEIEVERALRANGTFETIGGIVGLNEYSSALAYPNSTAASRFIAEFHAAAKAATLASGLDFLKERLAILTPEEVTAELVRLGTVLAPDRKKGDTGPTRFDFADLLAFDRDSDPTCVLGNRWLCRGGSCLLVAQTGAGKSALTTQAAMSWALGRDFFGIKSRKGPLRSLVIQSENDLGDVAESVQGTLSGLGIPASSDLARDIGSRVLFCREAVRTGDDFGKLLRELVLAHQADLVFVDPLLGFAGIDIADQEQASHFLRHVLQPVLTETGVILFSIHHTTKPKPKAETAGATSGDLSYLGAGSAELANWHRAVIVLQKDATEDGQPDLPHYTLRLAKRGGRAGLKDDQGNFTQTIPLRHAKEPGVIRWERRQTTEQGQTAAPNTQPIERKGVAKAVGWVGGYPDSHNPDTGPF